MPDPLALPVHPALVHVPIAMLSAAWVCILARYVTGDLRWDQRARLFETVGVPSLLPALVAGLFDARGPGFLLSPRAGDPTLWHAVAGLVAAAAFAVHVLWRSRHRPEELTGRRAAGDVAVATLGMLGILAAGMIGGEMVHGQG